jgi:hypothetical protein
LAAARTHHRADEETSPARSRQILTPRHARRGHGGSRAVARVGRWIGPPSAPTTIQIADRDVQPQRTDARHGPVEAPLAKWPLSHAMPARRRRRQPGCACSAQHAIIPGTARALALRGSRGRGEEGTRGTENRMPRRVVSTPPSRSESPSSSARQVPRFVPICAAARDGRVNSTWPGAPGTNQNSPTNHTSSRGHRRHANDRLLISASQPRR